MISKVIDGTNGRYACFEDGSVYCLLRERFISTYVQSEGYRQVRLFINGVKKYMYVHRILATLFIPNPQNKDVVNHKDGNKLNNALSNLEWCTQAENVKHSFAIGTSKPLPKNELNKRSIKVCQYNMDGVLIKVFPSIMEIKRSGFALGNIYRVLSDGSKTAYKHYWIKIKNHD